MSDEGHFPATQPRSNASVAVALGTTTLVSYGSLFYAFGVLAPNIAGDLDLSLTAVYAIFSASLGGAALVAPLTGHSLDRFKPAQVMALGSVLSAALLALLAFSQSVVLAAFSIIVVQMVATMVLYEAAFALAGFHAPKGARRTITMITLIAGFASTVFWPLTAFLLDHVTWREIYLIYAVLHLVICLPIHLWLVREPGQGSARKRAEETGARSVAGSITSTTGRQQALYLMIWTFAAFGFTISAVHLHLIGILGEMGLVASAPFIGALIGPSQVAGRLVEFFSGGKLPALWVVVFSGAALPLSLFLLIVGPASLWVAVLAAILFGLGQGVTYIARGVLPLELFGTKGYGANLGRLNAATLTTMAIAPALTAALRETYGVKIAIAMIACVACTALIAALGLSRVANRS